jgi:hypothetical protein
MELPFYGSIFLWNYHFMIYSFYESIFYDYIL